MIKKLTRLLGNIVGRIKENMPAIWLGLTAILIPVSMYMIVESVDLSGKKMAFMVLALGAIALVMAIYSGYKHDMANMKDRNQLVDKLDSIHKELKGLRGDINEHTDSEDRK